MVSVGHCESRLVGAKQSGGGGMRLPRFARNDRKSVAEVLNPYQGLHNFPGIGYTIQRELFGDFSGVDPPVTIPHTEVKRSSADDT
jgi:hypothetical protein